MEPPQTHYAQNGELAIAYQVHGSGDHDLLLSVGSASNIATMWDLPEGARLLERLGQFARVIRYDRRDSGLSDPIKDDLTLEAHASDALAVIEAVGARRPVLFGSLDGARSLALLAATHPDRVGGLIALSPTARGGATGTPEFVEAVTRNFADPSDFPGEAARFFAPGWAADPVRGPRLARYLQSCLAPVQAARLLRMSLTSDIGEVLPLVQAPTLGLHPRDQRLVAAEEVQGFTELVPNARFREIPGDAGLIFALDVDLLGDIIEEFVTGTAPAPTTDRVLATVLFTDLVDSTRRAASMGDRAWSDLLKRHLDRARAAVAAHGGETIETTGDGLLAIFTGPGQGVRAAARIIEDSRDLGLEVRSGLHTGEVERSPGDISGLAVHLAARIMAIAGAGEILVSGTVRDLVIGSELSFTDRGEHELKGIPDSWSVWAAS